MSRWDIAREVAETAVLTLALAALFKGVVTIMVWAATAALVMVQ